MTQLQVGIFRNSENSQNVKPDPIKTVSTDLSDDEPVTETEENLEQ